MMELSMAENIVSPVWAVKMRKTGFPEMKVKFLLSLLRGPPLIVPKNRRDP